MNLIKSIFRIILYPLTYGISVYILGGVALNIPHSYSGNIDISNRCGKIISSLLSSPKIIKPIKVRNQCAFDTCWVYSNIARLEVELSNVVGDDLALSAEYFVAKKVKL